MTELSIEIQNAQIGDLVKFKELNIWGEIVNLYPFNKIDIQTEQGDVIEGLGWKETNIYREIEEGTEIECLCCNGEGTEEIGPDCSRPASSCCGGCFMQVECEECSGTGLIILE